MSKELLKALKEIYDGMYNRQGFIEEFKMIEKALTPPTAEEVCEALSEYTGQDVYYERGYWMYHSNIAGSHINLNQIPSYLITLIGRFYSGMEAKK